MAIHFKTTKERLDFLKGKHEEIVPVEIKPVEVIEEPKAEPKEEEKPKKKTQSKAKAKKKDDGKVQAK